MKTKRNEQCSKMINLLILINFNAPAVKNEKEKNEKEGLIELFQLTLCFKKRIWESWSN
jgi:hypothetical protein